jgi:hypothetical protein
MQKILSHSIIALLLLITLAGCIQGGEITGNAPQYQCSDGTWVTNKTDCLAKEKPTEIKNCETNECWMDALITCIPAKYDASSVTTSIKYETLEKIGDTCKVREKYNEGGKVSELICYYRDGVRLLQTCS